MFRKDSMETCSGIAGIMDNHRASGQYGAACSRCIFPPYSPNRCKFDHAAVNRAGKEPVGFAEQPIVDLGMNGRQCGRVIVAHDSSLSLFELNGWFWVDTPTASARTDDGLQIVRRSIRDAVRLRRAALAARRDDACWRRA